MRYEGGCSKLSIRSRSCKQHSTNQFQATRLLSLPDEIIIRIMEMSCFETYASLCLANKRLSSIARPFLYANISLRFATYESCKWKALLRTLQTTEMTLAVKRLSCELNTRSRSASTSAIPDQERSTAAFVFLQIYSCCSRLQHLEFTSTFPLPPGLDEPLKDFLRTTTVTSLSVGTEWLPFISANSERQYEQFTVNPWRWTAREQSLLDHEVAKCSRTLRWSAGEVVFRGACWQYESDLLGNMQRLLLALPRSDSFAFVNCSRDREAVAAIFSSLPSPISRLRIVETHSANGQARRLDLSSIGYVHTLRIAYTGLVRQWPKTLEHLYLEQLDLTTMMELQRFFSESDNGLMNLLTISVPDTRSSFIVHRGAHYQNNIYELAKCIDRVCDDRKIRIYPIGSLSEIWQRVYAFDPRSDRRRSQQIPQAS